jgi:serine/threonine protein kinase
VRVLVDVYLSDGLRLPRLSDMSTTTVSFWELLEKAQLLSSTQCQQWRAEIAKENGGKNVADPKAIAEFLVGKNVLSRYQATVLLAGRPGPFSYGDYKVYDKVDKGRLSGMFRAVHGATGHPVLLQFLSGPVTQNPQSWGMASNEARIATRMVGPHLHRLFDLCDTPKHKFLVWEDLRGQTLEERLAAGRLPPSEACRVARQLALALATVHQGGRVHGDVRPISVWCDHAKGGAPSHTRLLRDPLAMPAPLMVHQPDPQGRTLAMADYAAPELQMPGALPNILTDVYSVGCVLYQLLSGSPPFPGGDAMQKMARHGNEPPRPLQAVGVPPPIEQLVVYLLAKNPGMRYQDTVSVAEQLSAFIDPAVLKVTPPAPSPTLVAFESQLKQSAAAHAATAPVIPVAAQMPAASSMVPGYAQTPAYSPNAQVSAPAPAAPVSIQTDGDSSTARSSVRRKRKTSLMPLWVTLASLGLFGAAGIAYWMSTKPEPDVVQNSSDSSTGDQGPESTTNTSNSADPAKTGDGENTKSTTTQTSANSANAQLVTDDGKTLWASPTEGTPIDLKYVPPEAQVVFCLRPTSMMATSEGPKVLKALGPEFQPVLEKFEKASGVKFADLDRLIVSLHNNDGNFPRVACVATLKEGESAKALVPTWDGVEEDKEGETAFQKGNSWSFWVPESEADRLFVMAEETDVRDVIKNPKWDLRREAERLRKSTDDQRHATVLFYPNFFFNNDSDLLFEGERARGREGLSWLLGEGVQAGAVSLHFDNAFYFEMRAMSKIDKDKRELADEFHKRFDSLPNLMRDYITFQLNPPPYWKLLANDFPRMIREFHENLRVGVEGDEAVMNCYLPVEAAHNLTLGAELAMATAPGGGQVVAAAGNGGGYTGPKTLEEAMNKLTISEFSFDSLSLEFAIRDLQASAQDAAKGAPFPLELVIIGKDLELDGITRNQSVRDFKQEKVPLGEVLTALAKKAHPKLIWAYGPHPDDEKKTVVLLTTRTQAAKKMYKVPDAFKDAPAEKKSEEKKKDDNKKKTT